MAWNVHDPTVTGRVPKLGGLEWESVAPYLEEFLKRLMYANDGTQTAIEEVTSVPTDHGELTGLEDDDHPQYTTFATAMMIADLWG